MAVVALPYKLQGLIHIKFWSEDFFWITKKSDRRSNAQEIKDSDYKFSELLLLEDGNCLKEHGL